MRWLLRWRSLRRPAARPATYAAARDHRHAMLVQLFHGFLDNWLGELLVKPLRAVLPSSAGLRGFAACRLGLAFGLPLALGKPAPFAMAASSDPALTYNTKAKCGL